MKPRFLEKYRTEVVPYLAKKFGYKNKLQAPELKKIILNVGMSEALQDIKFLDSACKELETITGQKPVYTRARKAIANFKIRKGVPVGCKVTLRRAFMYEFLDRLISVAIPRIKDFRGLNPKSFDKAGNYSFGIDEQLIFPEIEFDKIQMIHGMDIIIQIKSNSAEESYELLKALGMPFKK